MQANGDISIPEIIELPGMEDVKAELEDPRYRRAHGHCSQKCTGPLCRYVERQSMRNRSMKRAMLEGREFKPYGNRVWDRDELIEAIIFWHKRDRLVRKLQAMGRTQEEIEDAIERKLAA